MKSRFFVICFLLIFYLISISHSDASKEEGADIAITEDNNPAAQIMREVYTELSNTAAPVLAAVTESPEPKKAEDLLADNITYDIRPYDDGIENNGTTLLIVLHTSNNPELDGKFIKTSAEFYDQEGKTIERPDPYFNFCFVSNADFAFTVDIKENYYSFAMRYEKLGKKSNTDKIIPYNKNIEYSYKIDGKVLRITFINNGDKNVRLNYVVVLKQDEKILGVCEDKQAELEPGQSAEYAILSLATSLGRNPEVYFKVCEQDLSD